MSTSSPSPARLTVDLDALAANYRAISVAAGGVEVTPVVKADAYGLGATAVARRLHTEGARTFFVARLSEGEALRAALGPARPGAIYVLDGLALAAPDRLRAAGLSPVLNDPADVEQWRAGAGGRPTPAALHVDTGMNRLGLTLEQAAAAAGRPGLNVTLILSHLACASEPGRAMNTLQLVRFKEARRLFPEARAGLANSGGAFLGPEHRFDFVRPGISLYGGGPFEAPDARIRAVATLDAPVLQAREIAAGESVGYAAGFTAPRPMRVATVGIGYADGVLRSSSPDGSVWLHGGRRRLLGRVSMDLLAIDVTDCPEVAVGDRVELFGPNLPLDEAAAAAGTIAYELLVRVGPRVERVYR